MMKSYPVAFMSIVLVCLIAFSFSVKEARATVIIATPAPPPAQDLIDTIGIQGSIQGRNINFTLDFDFNATRKRNSVDLIQGAIVLDQIDADPSRIVRYDASTQTYSLAWKKPGAHHVNASFAVQSQTLLDHAWREATFQVPTSRVRQLSVICDRTDLEVQFPGALRQTAQIKDGQLVITAILGPGHPFTVRWKPQVKKLDAKLVLSSRINSIARVSSGAMVMDHLFAYQIAQGQLDSLHFSIPKNVSITQVRGIHIRDWQITPTDDAQQLVVTLSQPQTHTYALQILSEIPLATFPIDQPLPVIEPLDGTHSSGHLAVGADSAISVVIDQAAGLSQIDASTFPRQVLEKQYTRPLPTRNAFYYSFSSPTYTMDLKLADIVSSFDVTQHLAIQVKEDDLVMNAHLELEVRDAPLQQLTVTLPQGFSVSSVTGADVDDYNTPQQSASQARQLVIDFTKPVLGRTVIQMQMELGATPLQTTQQITGPIVNGVKTSRGDIQILGEDGVELDEPTFTELREVHAGSLSMRQAGSRFAYRFRDHNWTLDLTSRKKASGIRTESFHLLSIGEGVVYGSVAVNYFISGAPIDELTFQIPPSLGAIEFVGSDVRRWDNNGDIWTVKLSRKVIGDYNLGVFFTHQYDANQPIDFGAVHCQNVETQTGFITVASHVNLQLVLPTAASSNLMPITPDEVPANYRLLVNAPVLRSFKYVQAPHASTMVLTPYKRGQLLPVVIEMMHLKTAIGIDQTNTKSQTVETVTTATYKVKNTSSQFLTLKLPQDAMVWSTHLLSYDKQGRETRTRITASQNGAELMIPLKRNRNPNEPTTLQVQYAQSHDSINTIGQLTIDAPSSQIESTFAQWHVQADSDQGIFPLAAGNMLADERPMRWGDLVRMLSQTATAWKVGLNRFIQNTSWWAPTLCAALALTLLTFAFKRELTLQALFACVIGIVMVNGILAAQSESFLASTQQIDPLNALDFTQPLTLDANQALRVNVIVKPAWFQYATRTGYLICPILLLVGLIGGALFRRLRVILWSLAGAAALYGGAQFNIIEIGETQIPVILVLTHLLTWGLPALAFIWILYQLAARSIHSAAKQSPQTTPPNPTGVITATLLLFALILTGGCASQTIEVPLADATLNRIAVDLSAEKDSMNINYTLHAQIDQPTQIKLLPDTAVLMTSDKPQPNVRIITDSGFHWIHLTKKGDYHLNPVFLTPLAPADSQLTRSFSLTLPLALTNQINLTIPQTGLQVDSTTAIQFTSDENQNNTTATAIVAPGASATFHWKPRERQIRLEKTVFIADVTTLASFDTAHVQLYNNIFFQIAQGELKDIKLRIPQGMTVNEVTGANLGTWRFDPATHLLEARLNQGATGEYRLNLVTQISAKGMPWQVDLTLPVVENASRQRGSIGLLPNDKVYLQIKKQTQAMNSSDFLRQLQPHMKSITSLPASAIRHAFRMFRPTDQITAQVLAVKPELRTVQSSSFNVGDERMIFNGDYTINVTKAGIFSATLILPADYDIDALTAPDISHWDESTQNDQRLVQIHFKQKVIGPIHLKLTLSQPLAQLPPQIQVPRIQLLNAIKHTGQIIVSTERGLKVAIAQRQGVSELNPADQGIRTPGVRVFKLLRPDWNLTFTSDIIAPRTTVQFLHVARVTDAMVRHTHYLRFQMTQAGRKIFNVQLPANTLGLVINGPDIANMKEIDPDQHIWRIELARKWLDQPWPLTLEYEKQYDMTTGAIDIQPVLPQQGDLFRGSVVIQTTDKVEIQTANIGPNLQASESRNIPKTFGATDLAQAAFTFRTAQSNYQLSLNAQRHSAAQQLQADVTRCLINTVVNEQGQTINQVNLNLRVGDLRNLATTLPPGARIWSLMVNNRSTEPSLTLDANNQQRILIPVAQASSSELQVEVEFIYVLPQQPNWTSALQNYQGPQFDLPLKNINWTFYLPDDLEYNQFKGTLSVDDETIRNPTLVHYDASTYQERQIVMQELDNRTAINLQQRGQQLVREGRQREAKQILNSAYNYSFNDFALNEDTLVQLHRLNQQQAMVGLKSRRGYIRPNVGQAGAQLPESRDLSDQYTEDEARRELSSLDKADSQNLEIISGRIIQAQEAAAGHNVPLNISLALRGRKIEFTRSLQVSPDVPMTVNFEAKPIAKEYKTSNLAATACAFAALMLLLTALPRIINRTTAETV